MNYIERYWRDAKPEDAIKEPPMVARFKSSKDGVWFYGKLYGIDRTSGLLFVCAEIATPFCQVYDAPDPGEGWRLIDPDKDDYRQDGIEFWYHIEEQWQSRSGVGMDKHPFTTEPLTFYRICITPTVTYVPFTWEDREQLRGRWIERDSIEFQVTHVRNENGLYANRIDADSLCKYWKFLDTGKPVGKEVTQ